MTLASVATFTKRFIVIFIATIVLGISAFIGYKIWYAHYLAGLPPIVEKPDIKFGNLPSIDFPVSDVSSSNFSYSLDTTTGNLPDFDNIIKVYFSPKSYTSLLAPEKTADLAKQFEIENSPQILTETKYKFSSGTNDLTVNLDSGNFIYQSEASKSAGQTLDDTSALATDFRNFLSAKGILKDELKAGPSKITLLKFDNNQFSQVESLQEAQAVRISLWPSDIDKKPILTSDFNKALVNAIIIKNASDLTNYIQLNYIFWPIDITTFGTYPLKSSNTAFSDLKSGKGIILIKPTKPQVSITSLYLAYYMPENYSQYLQPVYVFEGPSFVAYVPAIDDQFINQPK